MTTTTNYLLTKPTVGGDADAWGGYLNTDADLIDAALSGIAASLLNGLVLSTVGASATFTTAAGAAGDSSGRLMILASSLAKTTSGWAVGASNGSLDTGGIATNTWYHVWIIKRVDTGVVDILTSLSATAPTMPTNYTLKRRIGAMKTDGSSQWKAFVQVGDEFLWLVPVQDVSTSTLTTAQSLDGLSVPAGIQVTALLRGDMNHASANTIVLVNSPDATNAAPSAGNFTAIQQVAGQALALGELRIRTNTSGQVRSRSSASNTTLELVTYGWIDPRGKF